MEVDAAVVTVAAEVASEVAAEVSAVAIVSLRPNY